MESPLVPFRDVLLDLSRTDADPKARRRAQCLVVWCACASHRQAAVLTGVSERALCRWSDRFLAEGRQGLVDRPRSGRPRTLDAAAEAFLRRVLEELPTDHGYATASWTRSDLQDLLARHGWTVVSGTVSRALHRLGYRYRRPRHDLQHRQDADAVATAKQALGVLQKKGLITQEDDDSCISTSANCTPIPTWQRSGNPEEPRAPYRPPVSTDGSRSSEPWNITPER